MGSFERFQEPQLPSKDAIYSSLTEEDISEIDYIHVQRVFNHFDMTDLGDYRNFRLLTVCFYWLAYSRSSVTCASNIVLVLPIITLPLVCLGKLLLK